MDGISELAKMFKERNNPDMLGITTGKVIVPPPNTKIQLNDRVILENDRLIFSAHVLNNYTREIEMLNYSGQMNFTDTLMGGDEVILVPTSDKQKYFVIDKAVRL